jgi:hypothetical protein
MVFVRHENALVDEGASANFVDERPDGPTGLGTGALKNGGSGTHES